jgi:hypothetical protein
MGSEMPECLKVSYPAGLLAGSVAARLLDFYKIHLEQARLQIGLPGPHLDLHHPPPDAYRRATQLLRHTEMIEFGGASKRPSPVAAAVRGDLTQRQYH